MKPADPNEPENIPKIIVPVNIQSPSSNTYIPRWLGQRTSGPHAAPYGVARDAYFSDP